MGNVDGTADLADFLRSLGASDEQIGVARGNLHLASLATDLILAEGARMKVKHPVPRDAGTRTRCTRTGGPASAGDQRLSGGLMDAWRGLWTDARP